jgi:hypothetical protein
MHFRAARKCAFLHVLIQIDGEKGGVRPSPKGFPATAFPPQNIGGEQDARAENAAGVTAKRYSQELSNELQKKLKKLQKCQNPCSATMDENILKMP